MLNIAAKICFHPPLPILTVVITPALLVLLLYLVAKFGKARGRGAIF